MEIIIIIIPNLNFIEKQTKQMHYCTDASPIKHKICSSLCDSISHLLNILLIFFSFILSFYSAFRRQWTQISVDAIKKQTKKWKKKHRECKIRLPLEMLFKLFPQTEKVEEKKRTRQQERKKSFISIFFFFFYLRSHLSSSSTSTRTHHWWAPSISKFLWIFHLFT